MKHARRPTEGGGKSEGASGGLAKSVSAGSQGLAFRGVSGGLSLTCRAVYECEFLGSRYFPQAATTADGAFLNTTKDGLARLASHGNRAQLRSKAKKYGSSTDLDRPAYGSQSPDLMITRTTEAAFCSGIARQGWNWLLAGALLTELNWTGLN